VNRRLTSCAALLAVAALSTAPAHAATKKKAKPKPIDKTYTVSLLPDPTLEASGQIGDGCASLNPASQDKHPFTVPAAGTLKVVLDSADPTGTGNTDWDLYVLDSDGSILDSSHGGSSHEETLDKFKKKNPVTIWVCNLIGQPDGTVHYTFTYA
jgi:hypothetical protein